MVSTKIIAFGGSIGATVLHSVLEGQPKGKSRQQPGLASGHDGTMEEEEEEKKEEEVEGEGV